MLSGQPLHYYYLNMVFRAEGLFPLADLILSFTGCLGWLWVGLLWRDRALIILNSVAVVIS